MTFGDVAGGRCCLVNDQIKVSIACSCIMAEKETQKGSCLNFSGCKIDGERFVFSYLQNAVNVALQ